MILAFSSIYFLVSHLSRKSFYLDNSFLYNLSISQPYFFPEIEKGRALVVRGTLEESIFLFLDPA